MKNTFKFLSAVTLFLASFSSQSALIASDLDTGVHGRNNIVTYSFNNLSDHNTVNINFDLTMWDSWDGDHWYWGSDIFGMRVDGDTIFEYSFTNFTNPAWAGTNPYTETTFAHLGRSGWRDKFYEDYAGGFELTHSASDLTVEFYSQGLQSYRDESWQVSNLDITAVPEPSVLALMALGLAGLRFTQRRKLQK